MAIMLPACPRGVGNEDGAVGPETGARPDASSFVYDPTVGQPFSGPIVLDDERVRAIDPADLPVANAPCRAPVRARVTSVLDGDTFWVSGLSEQLSVKVRVIGVDTPEKVFRDTPAECYSDEAEAFTKQLEDHEVWLTFDAECTDDTASVRTLAYVWTGVGPQDSWERQLLRRGFARAFPFGNNRSFAGQYEADQTTAVTSGTGLWSACP